MEENDPLLFIERCRFIAKARGTKKTADRFTYLNFNCGAKIQPGDTVYEYEDDVIHIHASHRTPALLIERKENRNPTTMVMEDGDLIRHHGEWTYMKEHVTRLCRSI